MTEFYEQFYGALRKSGNITDFAASNLPDAQKRFDVYRNNLAVGLRDALRSAFPVLQSVLGEDNFDVLAHHYIASHLPKSPIMAEYGDDMPAFLTTCGSFDDMPYLPDIARIEQAMRESYHAADHDPIAPDQIMLPKYDGNIGLCPSMRIITSKLPIYDIWQFATKARKAQPRAAAQDVVIIRKEFDPMVFLLPPCGGAFLAAITQTGSINDALHMTQTLAIEDFKQLFELALTHGAFVDLKSKEYQA